MVDDNAWYTGNPFTAPQQSFVTYVVKTAASAAVVTATEAKVQARVDPTILSEDTYFDMLIAVATSSGELYTHRDFINKAYYAYLDFFPQSQTQGITLCRSKLQIGTAPVVQYLVNGTYQTLDSSLYYITDSADFSTIYLNYANNPNALWPQNVDSRNQAIRITFTAGYGAAGSAVPVQIRQAILQHVTFMYQSRGDASDGGFQASMPQLSIDLYEQFKIVLQNDLD
jgi:uncharacterized phiE125 gp8 family phage protein